MNERGDSHVEADVRGSLSERSGGMIGRLALDKLFRDEKGVTTVGMAVAIFLSLSLIFTSAQVYRVSSSSAAIQEVADACALASENEVAEFMVAVRICDAVILSLTLLSVCAYGLGVVALCVPQTAGLGADLLKMGQKTLSARDAFADKASRGLNALQKALPFIAAAQGASIAAANNAGDSSYYAACVLVPAEGTQIAPSGAQEVAEWGSGVEEEAESIRGQAEEVEEAARQAQEAKQRAFDHDCGRSPGYCMHERAEKLAELPSGENPRYSSVDAWSFSVALERARAYYEARAQRGIPESGSVSERAGAALRKRFYLYAAQELKSGFVIDAEDRFEAHFPHLYCNMEEFRATPLYAERAHPVTEREGRLAMHAWDGCPAAVGAVSAGSVQELEERASEFDVCPSCGFVPSSIGNIAAASTSIDNGFEHHYEAVARAAEDYELARRDLDPLSEQVKGEVTGLFEGLGKLIEGLGAARIDAAPPGCLGAVAMVVDVGSARADAGFESLFVAGGATLGTRAAVSGATLVVDSSEEGATVISSLLDGLSRDAGGAVGAARIVLGCWSGLLLAYAKGHDALGGALRNALGLIPLTSSGGLGRWAADKLEACIADAGLAPAELGVLKPVLINTGHVAGGDDGVFSVRFKEVKQRAIGLSSSSSDLFTALVDDVEEEAYGLVEKMEEGIVVAVIEFPVGGFAVPITLALPSGVVGYAEGLLARCFGAVRAAAGSVVGLREWS